MHTHTAVVNKVKQSFYRGDRPCGFQNFEGPRFSDNRYKNMVRLSSLSIGRPYTQEIFLVLLTIKV
jgi:hypothetical protein